MLMFTNLNQKVTSYALIVSVVAFSPSVATASSLKPSLVSGRLCAGASVIAAAAEALKLDGVGKSELMRSGATAKVSTSAKGVMARVDSRSAMANGSVTLPNSAACLTDPQNQTLAGHNDELPARFLGAFQLVEAYRSLHPWPLGSADVQSASTGVIMEDYDHRYIIVMLSDNSPKYDAQGQRVLGCSGEEYYRIDPASTTVLPFDGCVEGHQRVLPSFSQLPT